jgi:hypothetical protein
MCGPDRISKKNKGGDEHMGVTVNSKPIKSTEINFKSDKDYKDFMKLVNNPPPPSEYVKELIEKYQKQSENK